MNHLNITEARATLFRLVDEVAAHHEPVLITGKRNNAVLLSEEDWRSIQETLYLFSIPGMRESIVEGINAPASELISLEEFRRQMDQDEQPKPRGGK